MVALVVIHGAPEVLPEASVKLEAFTLGESIGRGAFASVVKARWGESLVAVKRWHVALIASESIRVPLEPDSEAYECFANELRVCSLEGVTEHVNLVRLMGFGYIAPRLGSGIAGFLVMEAAEGVDLRRRLRDARAISFEQCSMWITGLARALSHLHSRGFVHRDVKPSNLMVREEGEAKLVDYGLAVQLFLPAASATASATSATASATSLAADGLHAPSTTREGPLLTRFQADAQVGVYPFMAPEVYRKQPWGQPIDVWATGMTLYQVLARCRAPPVLAALKAAVFESAWEWLCSCGLAAFYERRLCQPGLHPRWPSGLSRALVACRRLAPAARPTAEQLVRLLESNSEASTDDESSGLRPRGLLPAELSGVLVEHAHGC